MTEILRFAPCFEQRSRYARYALYNIADPERAALYFPDASLLFKCRGQHYARPRKHSRKELQERPICFAALIANRCEAIDCMETHGTPGTLMEKRDLRPTRARRLSACNPSG